MTVQASQTPNLFEGLTTGTAGFRSNAAKVVKIKELLNLYHTKVQTPHRQRAKKASSLHSFTDKIPAHRQTTQYHKQKATNNQQSFSAKKIIKKREFIMKISYKLIHLQLITHILYGSILTPSVTIIVG